MSPFLRFSGITKRFPGVLALQGISFTIERGACHALMGENGAGKSTLGGILAGIHMPDEGEIQLQGTRIRATSPLEARAAGIAMVQQELAFCPNLSVAENLCLGELPTTAGWVRTVALNQRATAMLASVHSSIRPETPMDGLTPGQIQQVQIAAAVGTGASVIVMDEPTSSLALREAQDLFALIRTLRDRGITIIYVSHRMEEIFENCDWITVLRDGRHVATERISATTPARVVMQMVGREVLLSPGKHLSRSKGPAAISVRGLSSPNRFSDVTFDVHAGEVLGIAGLIGAGRTAVAEAIMGLDAQVSGSISISRQELPLRSIEASLEVGIGLVPEDRKRQGLVLGMSCRENSSLAVLPELSSFGWVQRNEELRIAGQFAAKMRLKAPTLDTMVGSLSGGNQQKIALAKWLARDCKVLIVDEPTKGIDIVAKTEIYELLDELACRGQAILVISSDLPELLGLARRILVMREGRLVGEVERANFSETLIMRLMSGLGLGRAVERSPTNTATDKDSQESS